MIPSPMPSTSNDSIITLHNCTRIWRVAERLGLKFEIDGILVETNSKLPGHEATRIEIWEVGQLGENV